MEPPSSLEAFTMRSPNLHLNSSESGKGETLTTTEKLPDAGPDGG